MIYQKYSTLPNLKKITHDEVFERDFSESPRIQEEKKDALENQNCFFEQENDPEFYEICAEWITTHHPKKFSSCNYEDIIREADEDFLIHRIKEDQDWLCSAHVCFPSHWRPEEKIGKSFEEMHRHIPMNLKNSKKLVETIVRHGTFERFVWSVIHDKKYNFHPRLPYSKFDKKNPKVLVKVERQVTVAFPEKDFCLFVLRQYLIPEDKLDKNVLAKSIEGMAQEERIYKGLAECGDLLEYLKSRSDKKFEKP